jgi:SAM-dependent methyltransferase
MRRCLRCEARFAAADWRCPACGSGPADLLGLPAFAPALAPAEIAYDASRFEVLAEVESGHFWFRSRARLIVWALRRHFPRARSMLEVGCGTGQVLAAVAQALPALRLAGAEAHPRALGMARRRVPRAELLQMDCRQIPFREEFDVLGAFDVIEHVDDDERVLREMHASCRSGGGIMITVPQHPWLWSYRDEFARHFRRYRRRDLLRKLRAAGFERPWATSFVTCLLPLMVLSRWRQAKPEGFDASGELKLGGMANRAFGAVMALERRLIAAGLRLPAGGSLLVVAHKC